MTYEEESPIADSRCLTRTDHFGCENETGVGPRSDSAMHVQRCLCHLRDSGCHDEHRRSSHPGWSFQSTHGRPPHLRCAVQFQRWRCHVQRWACHEERCNSHDGETPIDEDDNGCASSDCRPSNHHSRCADSPVEIPLHARHFPSSRRRRVDATSLKSPEVQRNQRVWAHVSRSRKRADQASTGNPRTKRVLLDRPLTAPRKTKRRPGPVWLRDLSSSPESIALPRC